MEGVVIEMTDGESCTRERSGSSCGGGCGGPSMEHFRKPRSVSAEMRQPPPEPFCSHQDRNTYKEEPEPGVEEEIRLGVGPWCLCLLVFIGCLLLSLLLCFCEFFYFFSP